MEDALRRSGLSSRDIRRGQIYWIDDDLINFPTERLSDQPERTKHEGRLVLILQTDLDNCNPTCLTVLIAPLSHKVEYQDTTDYMLSIGQGGLPRDSIVELDLIQALNKVELRQLLGKLDPVTMAGIDAVIAANLGLSERPSPPSL